MNCLERAYDDASDECAAGSSAGPYDTVRERSRFRLPS
jgi:hypothetical protein